ncbi:unnamed protein product [Polarella glacialis]|uniref:Uncharacterized protein n=1 Tax=Polarella glacialis TaxID=89957 RepID=A0A813D3V2_POLGL|nr:unnamed protein product [Polarella glacialis]
MSVCGRWHAVGTMSCRVAGLCRIARHRGHFVVPCPCGFIEASLDHGQLHVSSFSAGCLMLPGRGGMLIWHAWACQSLRQQMLRLHCDIFSVRPMLVAGSQPWRLMCVSFLKPFNYGALLQVSCMEIEPCTV